MNIHEYQGKDILRKFGVAVPRGIVAYSPEEAKQAAEQLFDELGCPVVVIKAQIHAGGRGKAGGVKLAKSPEESLDIAHQLIGMTLITHQTGPEGKEVRRVLVEEGMNIEKEFYVGITLDRSTSKNVLMVSTEGGMEIEKVAEETPERLLKIQIDPLFGMQGFQAREAAFFLGLKGEQFRNAVNFITALYNAYISIDAALAEINPLVVTKEGKVLALDAKINFDDNALFRHKEFHELRDTNEEDPFEVEASKSNLNYVRLDGNVGCMVNGAGLAMGTMDMIQLAGGKPANFLDVGGSASPQTVEEGFKIILSDKNVKAILVNIFGGIVRCDRVAGGIIEAAKKIDLHLPVIVRLEGTNAPIAQKMLDDSGLNLIAAKGLRDAAQKVQEALAAS
ncbi:ADP-forming succinate--CoA ligase subunit beta [Pelodictyon phaeoclathratiforme]|jgi:succinyl-CoA synthetase beta subunit|uniref:Succinate--CoA ligase [ADP-forming] subunit beta n=1 Tax=Pelodictyon phaeoclathratiforme (strain DSM 5477 / BU-1) TaxID=324925 RepID=SUCC_PELPB|nr:ADP-forming succinate--CoA ligase subunit beta [Pelodictyon phaeoclathratiforme]B4SEH6.1 RecName: Full=Succinate--CoA ligase [ADP-forming] subunit beta; AltName: Full=Succinyl-CoA synthetase subunit beta; Short=SCS-beta [Pelodictyon phaeoclathratiforme BU-1]ACF43068.1 succinyl-CoA synthetase, beta subunit [Pelodictyon phaeoclathratiforme BU-1]MBV5289188.1 ADP-forming succinate--CoA ligase subunit beta [Pelodictyon phaeoclathratiforme]